LAREFKLETGGTTFKSQAKSSYVYNKILLLE
jgi:hypothetical protein